MNRPFVKICGVTRLADALAAADLGVQAIGFVFVPGSPRIVNPETAGAIAAALPRRVARVGVARGATAAQAAAWRREAGITVLQAHGEESPELCRSCGMPVVKAVWSRPGLDPADLDAWLGTPLLVDAFSDGRSGGTGRLADWNLARALVERGHRVVLAGGLTPENLLDAVNAVRPLAVDLNSGVESAPGRKDASRIEAALRALAAFPPSSPEETPWPSFPT